MDAHLTTHKKADQITLVYLRLHLLLPCHFQWVSLDEFGNLGHFLIHTQNTRYCHCIPSAFMQYKIIYWEQLFLSKLYLLK